MKRNKKQQLTMFKNKEKTQGETALSNGPFI